MANFSISATGSGPLTYQWRKDGMDIASATNVGLTVTNIGAIDAGTYCVVVTGSCKQPH